MIELTPSTVQSLTSLPGTYTSPTTSVLYKFVYSSAMTLDTTYFYYTHGNN